jgi:hypothetical protein
VDTTFSWVSSVTVLCGYANSPSPRVWPCASRSWIEPHDSFHYWVCVMVLQFLAYVRECEVNDQP